jgi:phage baseplate assembly protein W
MNDVAFPWRADTRRGRTAIAASEEEHIADMIEAVLFTAPGERVNRPDFGCGLESLVFAPLDAALLGATELQVRGGLQRWLGDEIEVDAVELDAEETTVRITVRYRVAATGRIITTRFERGGA